MYYYPITNSPHICLVVLSAAACQLTGEMQRHREHSTWNGMEHEMEWNGMEWDHNVASIAHPACGLTGHRKGSLIPRPSVQCMLSRVYCTESLGMRPKGRSSRAHQDGSSRSHYEEALWIAKPLSTSAGCGFFSQQFTHCVCLHCTL